MGRFDDAAAAADFFSYDDSPASGGASGASYKTALLAGGLTAPNPLALLTDTVAGDRTTNATITVGGAAVVSTINTLGDFDFFKVELTAGKTYEFLMLGKIGGPSLVPNADSLVELYDANGVMLGSADGGASSTLNAANSGFDAMLTFTAPTDGIYYVNARSFDQDPTNGSNGDSVGDYELSARLGDPRAAYKPLYSIDSPLHSIDWGTQVDRTVRNPDGENGPRDNGAPNTGVLYNSTFDVSGKNVITYYFAKGGDLFVDGNPATAGSTDTMIQAADMADWEKAAFKAAFAEYEKVADVLYIEVQNRAEADFKLITYQGTPGVGASLLGRMSPPNEENEGQAEFNRGDVRWTQEGLAQGGFYFPTLLHEFGHGHGMAHPHDNGGHSSVMRGSDDGSVIGGATADYDLSQQVFTIMSYNDGWTTSPYGQPNSGGITGTEAEHFGWMGTLAPMDIAVMQDKYGVNEEYALGDDVYALKDVNAVGTFYSAIWDAGGVDTMLYEGARDANLDLRAASLEYEYGGGGWVSYADGVHGGYVIANGAVIENAIGGSGADTLTGNDIVNVLRGRDGADVIDGMGGDDLLFGGAGNDTLTGGWGADQFWFEPGSGRDVIVDFVEGDTIGFGGGGPASFAELGIIADMRDGVAGTYITWGQGADGVWLQNVTPSSVTPEAFVFV